MYWRYIGDILEIYWRCIGEVLEKFLSKNTGMKEI